MSHKDQAYTLRASMAGMLRLEDDPREADGASTIGCLEHLASGEVILSVCQHTPGQLWFMDSDLRLRSRRSRAYCLSLATGSTSRLMMLGCRLSPSWKFQSESQALQLLEFRQKTEGLSPLEAERGKKKLLNNAIVAESAVQDDMQRGSDASDGDIA